MQVSRKENVNFTPHLNADGFTTFSNMNLLEEIILKDVWSPIVWQDGVRKSENFLSSDFLVLDFDKKEIGTIDEIDFFLRDYKRIIATTKSHMKNWTECFRVLIPFAQRITRLDIYKETLRLALTTILGADPACKDGARFFFPSKQIVRIDRDESSNSWPVAEKLSLVSVQKNTNNKEIPAWILNFINNGVLVEKGSRNVTVFRILIWFQENGFDLDWAVTAVTRAPINWTGVNYSATVKNLKKKQARN